MNSQRKFASKRVLRVTLVLGAAALSFAGLRWGEQQGSGLGASAKAFSSPSTFETEAVFGGGGGRFFTGSPRDGFTCGVCHQSERFFDIELEGFPDEIKAGQTYDLRFTWEGGAKRVNFNAEIVNAKGAMAGELVEDGDVESFLTDDEREVLTVVGVPKRTKAEVRFKWKAAADLSGPVTVHIAGVRKQTEDKNPEGPEKTALDDDELALYSAKIPVAGGSSASKPAKKKDSKD